MLNIPNFKKLRNHIAKNVKPSEIYMDWYFAERNGVGSAGWNGLSRRLVRSCNSVACIMGHAAFLFAHGDDRKTAEIALKVAAAKLGTSMTVEDDFRVVNVEGWPEDLRNMYKTGNARQKKASVLARLDRIIERGDTH